MNTRTNAVLVATAQTEIAVPLATIWKLQTDIDRWPTWQRDIAYARLEGPLQAGTLFRWKAMGLSIVSCLEEVVPMSRLAWSGNSLGMQAVHSWTFRARGGVTYVETTEALYGWFPRILKLMDPHFLDKSLEAALVKLKQAAERKAENKEG